MVTDIPRWEAEAKRRHLGFDPKGKAEPSCSRRPSRTGPRNSTSPDPRPAPAPGVLARPRGRASSHLGDGSGPGRPPAPDHGLEVPGEIEKGTSRLRPGPP